MGSCATCVAVELGAKTDYTRAISLLSKMDVGSLEMVAKVAHTVSEPVIGKIAVGVLSGLAYLYDQFRIVHRDIKPSNILVNSRGLVKLCDFGVSGELAGTSIGTFVGTGAYMSVGGWGCNHLLWPTILLY